MQALQLKRYGSLDHVAFAELPRPPPGPGELLVRVHAVGLNPIDYLIPRGDFKPILKLRLPATLGSDFAGVVVEVGSGVTRFKVGDAVYASIFDTPYGSLAEFAVVPEQAAAQIAALLEAGSIRPVIDQVFPFLQAKQALTYLAQGRARGKVVLRLPVP
ncbi:alcohol dehydrogenase catalytic domain-containing protein [Janthinobacterium sp. PAMC25594]|uniref:alcohol dehydrogenase catalytic domain-containing protein n=1 Tax=Janthinobacterium sp. PAMC25594 TaxID=2861284 RepID=UPI001C6381B9|nr:zinc-binding dehydrogenase [Janthinobacterium sp. PAMC25594]QYG07688.1 zinc-binding dehydrogenase [Janthinobacterium sp. PAMC25594]